MIKRDEPLLRGVLVNHKIITWSTGSLLQKKTIV